VVAEHRYDAVDRERALLDEGVHRLLSRELVGVPKRREEAGELDRQKKKTGCDGKTGPVLWRRHDAILGERFLRWFQVLSFRFQEKTRSGYLKPET